MHGHIYYNLPSAFSSQVCPEMQVNEVHAIYDEHHEMSPLL